MPPAKDLESHVRDGTFRSRRHHHLLDGPVVRWPELAVVQAKYRGAGHELERRALGVEFERTVREHGPATREAEQSALLELLRRPPSPVDDIFESDAPARELEQWASTSIARSLRRSGLTWAAIGGRLGVAASTVRRRVAAFEKTYARGPQNGMQSDECWPPATPQSLQTSSAGALAGAGATSRSTTRR